jgi:hypothetical protein
MIYAHGAIDMVLAHCAAPPFNQERVLASTTVREGRASASDGLGMNHGYHGCDEQVSRFHYGVNWPPKLMNAQRASHICPCANVKCAPQYRDPYSSSSPADVRDVILFVMIHPPDANNGQCDNLSEEGHTTTRGREMSSCPWPGGGGPTTKTEGTVTSS